MRLNHFRSMLFACLLSLGMLASCGVKDSSIQSAISEKAASTPALAGVAATVKDGVVTLAGEFKDEASKAEAETAVKAIKGVKSVVNNGTIALPPAPVVAAPAPVEIAADAALTQGVTDAIKSFPGVKADVKDGVVTLTGDIKRSGLQTLMMALNSLKPKKIENKLTIK
ncbi:MAG: BON domain-containing protein [Chitinophagaceae bacterium]